jgi:hypothetical protein
MDIAFIGDKDKFVVIYMDDITVFSRFDKEHFYHLRKVSLKCKKFGLSLNPKNSLFAMNKGKLLGHIVSVEGVRIDPRMVETIQSLSLPGSKKDVHSFLGKSNFLRRFVSNFVELIKNITTMLRKGNEIKWIVESHNSFDRIKKELMKHLCSLVLTTPRIFLIFSFSSFDTVAVVLLQNNVEGLE